MAKKYELGPLMKKKLSRRSALKTFGTFGVAPVVFGPVYKNAAEENVRSPLPGRKKRKFGENLIYTGFLQIK